MESLSFNESKNCEKAMLLVQNYFSVIQNIFETPKNLFTNKLYFIHPLSVFFTCPI